MVDDKYWQLLKRSLADQHRQYLEEVTEPMSLGFDAPEEFVTTKPSIYHSLRMQPIAGLDGQVRVKPARARKLRNRENKGFQDSIRNYSLPLTTNQGESLYGRHVYPGELYSLNRNFHEKHLPDVPNSYKLGWGNKDKYRPLNLYGFTGNSPIPQRHTATTFQPEGILYGNLDENDIVQLNRKPTTAYSLAQVARAIAPFHESMNVTKLGRNQQELASDIMEAGIPPILAESNVDTTGKTHALPFRIDEVSDVEEAHDPFVQWRPDSLMTSSPEGLEQFTLDNLRRKSEPMDLAMRLLKATLPTMREAGLSIEDIDALRWIPEKRKPTFYQAQLLNKPANRQYEINFASKKDDYKKIPGLHTESQLDMTLPRNSIHSYFVNPATRLGVFAGDITFRDKPTLLGIRNRNDDYGVDFWRNDRQGAGSEGGEGLIYGELPKQNFAEIPVNYNAVNAMRAKIHLDHYIDNFHIPEEEAFEMLATRFPEVHNIASQFPNVNTQDTSWQQPAQYRGTNPLLLDEIDTKVASEPMKNAWSTLLKSKPYHEMSNDELNDILYGLSGYDTGTREYSRDETSSTQEEKDAAFQELLTRQRETEGNPVSVFDKNQEEKSRLVDFYEPQFTGQNISPDVFIPQNEKEGQAAYEFMEDGEMGEHIDERLLDIDEFMPGKTFITDENYADKYNHLRATAPPEVAENFLNRYRDFVMRNKENPEYVNQSLMQMFDENQKVTAPQYTQEFPTDASIFDTDVPYKIMNTPDATGFQHNWQAKNASEPMDIAMRLLKLELAPPMTQGVEEETPMQEDIPMVDMTMDNYESPCECAERIRSDVLNIILDAMNNHEEYYDHIDEIKEMYQDWQSHECQEILEWAEGTEKYGDWCKNNMSETDQMKYTGEPMDIAMQLLKEEVPYGSRDYPPQEIAVSTGTPLMGSKNSGPAPEVCNMPGCESGLPPVIYRRMANPIRSIDNHEFMCEQCAYKNDMQSLLYYKMLKGEITLADFAMRLLKEEPLHLQGSNTLARRAREELQTDKTGANSPAYQEMMERMMDIYEPQDETIPLEDNLDQYAQETGINPWRSSPGQEIPNKHGGTAKVHLAPLTPIHTQPFYNWQAKNASEPMEIAMRLLKREFHPGRDLEGYLNADGHYRGDGTDELLYDMNDPEVQDFVNRLHLDKQPPVHLIPETLGMDLGYVEPELRVENRDTKLYHPMMMDEHENLDKFPDRKIVEREGGTKEELVSTSDPTSDIVGVGRTGRTLVSPKPTFQDIPFSEETGFTLSEPMEIAMQLLKERVSPEAKRHKLEYDKKYESSPERVKYREELNRERRRRNIMGQGGPDMSHTKDHTIVPEDSHTNRARHFKDKGTLL